jgi:hypothetical protein
LSRYKVEIAELIGWFKNRLKDRSPFQMTEEDYRSGTDALPKDLASLVDEASKHWENERKYELSYSQICHSFFTAAKSLDKIVLIAKHPLFRLDTPVFIKEVTVRETNEKLRDIPALITSVRGDEHVVTGIVAIGNLKAHRWCIVVKTEKLEEELTIRAN